MATVDTRDSRALAHFIRLAKNGRQGGASTGARTAHTLAMLMLDDGLLLDGLAIEGLIDFIRAAKAAPETTRDLVGG
jgi:hypothetical protein